MTSKKLIISALLALFLLGSVYFIMTNEDGVEAARPASVPPAARWVGGKDGGDWIDCKPISEEQTQCDIYSQEEGELIEKAVFLGSINQEVEIDFYDGERIVTTSGQIYPKKSLKSTKEKIEGNKG